jgi:glycosyltransferase involved in cell wall biosynthesis
VRILLDYRPALRHRTGVGQYAHQTAAALARNPLDRVTLFSSSWKDRLPGDVLPGTSQMDLRIPVSVLNLAWHRLEWPPIERLGGSADVVHSMHPLLMPSVRAARIVTIHDLYFLDHPAETRAEIRRDYPPLVRSHAQRADAVIAVSEYTRSLIESRLDVPGERIIVAPPGAPDWRPRSENAAGGPILFVGTLEPRKNLDGLLRAYARLISRLPEAPPLVLAGGGRASFATLRAADEPSISTRVRHVGYVSDPERERLFREASMLVLPSFDEGFGLPVLEAMTVGVPVIASARGALPEVAGDAALLVNPDADESIASAMETLLRDRSRGCAMARAGLARARAYTWTATAASVRNGYEAAIARRRGARR